MLRSRFSSYVVLGIAFAVVLGTIIFFASETVQATRDAIFFA